MLTKPCPISPKAVCICSSFLSAAILLGGCTSHKVAGARTKNLERVTVNDFVNPNASAQTQDEQPTGSTIDSPIDTPSSGASVETAQNTDLSGDGLILTPRATTDSPAIQSPTPPPSTTKTSLTLLEAKVGDVNGKPIFTNSFFAPLEDRLITEASQLSLAQWRQSAVNTISDRLNGIIADELLRAEALTSLTPNQRVGLQAFLNNFRSNLLSENLGSAQLAGRRIQQEEGVTLDEALRQKEVDTLVQLTLIQEVNRRVNVSWRDIQQRYERDIDLFSPPPTAIFRVIRAFKDDTEKITQIQTQLDEGVDFLKIAAGELNNYKSNADGMHTVLIEETYETTEFFGAVPEILNEQTQQLSIGESVGPVEFGSSVYWIKLMDIEQETISLYDAQLKIQRDLNLERRQLARDEYLDRLMERARVSSRQEVLIRLLQIAEERYGPRG